MKFYILQVFKTSIAPKGKPSDQLKDLRKLKRLIMFVVNPTSFLGRVMN